MSAGAAAGGPCGGPIAQPLWGAAPTTSVAPVCLPRALAVRRVEPAACACTSPPWKLATSGADEAKLASAVRSVPLSQVP